MTSNKKNNRTIPCGDDSSYYGEYSMTDNKPASLEAVLHAYHQRINQLHGSGQTNVSEVQHTADSEAIAAISALIPEKVADNIGSSSSDLQHGMHIGYNLAIDQIHKNFNGEV